MVVWGFDILFDDICIILPIALASGRSWKGAVQSVFIIDHIKFYLTPTETVRAPRKTASCTSKDKTSA